jgi:hypothetical protein
VKTPLPLGKMSAQAFRLEQLFYVTEDNKERDRLLTRARLIRIAMDTDERV